MAMPHGSVSKYLLWIFFLAKANSMSRADIEIQRHFQFMCWFFSRLVFGRIRMDSSIGAVCANIFVLSRNVIPEHAIRSSDSSDHSTK